MKLNGIEVIAFDADDTLWENENFFREAEQAFCRVVNEYGPEEEVMKVLFRVEMQNMELYGYGIKAFVLSMIETGLLVSDRKIRPDQVETVIGIGKHLLQREVILLDGVTALLTQLQPHFRLVVATKGDLLDQERKLKKSGLLPYFHHIEVMSNKREYHYRELLKHLDISPEKFMMVGNSLVSDILPVIRLGGYAVHVPFYTTWEHERMDPSAIESERFFELEHIGGLINLFQWQ